MRGRGPHGRGQRPWIDVLDQLTSIEVALRGVRKTIVRKLIRALPRRRDILGGRRRLRRNGRADLQVHQMTGRVARDGLS